ncbi:MAG: hypothetical protein ACRD4E_10385 [Bryobacteraceae bacterium]
MVPDCFGRVRADANRRDKLLVDMQRLRGSVYLEDGAIEASQLADGRHQADMDEASWHLLVVDQDERVRGCVRFHAYPEETQFLHLNVSRSPLAWSEEWGEKLKGAVESELALSRTLDLPCVEIGGWALDSAIRGTSEALRMALAMYSLSQAYGGSVGLTTATRRHCSATILRRIGGRSLQYAGVELPSYDDPQFKCRMEVLRFYSWAPNPRYKPWIEEIQHELRAVPVLADDSRTLPGSQTRRPSPRSTFDLSEAASLAFRRQQNFAEAGD